MLLFQCLKRFIYERQKAKDKNRRRAFRQPDARQEQITITGNAAIN